MFSQTMEYALRAVVWLAQNKAEGSVGSAQIAHATRLSPSYLSKVMQQLAQAGIVTSRRGVGGGFELKRDPSDLSVLDVINAVDPIQRINACPLGLKTHKRQRCSMHAQVDQALGLAEEAFRRSTIEALLNDESRPKPMLETR